VPPICQIHHTGRDHWITSVQKDADDPVIVFDSPVSKPYLITESLKMQLFTIYGKNSNHLQIDIPQIQQQTNGVDCGIFAIANAVEFCLNSFLGTSRLEFDKYLMRSHLIECLLQNKFQEFPKNIKKLSLKSNVNVEKQNRSYISQIRHTIIYYRFFCDLQ
jgi:Ulp1 family protease